MVRRKRFPFIRVRQPNPRQALHSAKELRHGIHAVHQLEHLFEHREKKAKRLAKILAGRSELGGTGQAKRLAEALGITAGEAAGGPLVITIGVTVAMEDLNDVPEETLGSLQEDIHEIMENTMTNTVSEAKSLAPVKTGALRDSISGQIDDSLLMITFRADRPYAIYQEDGTSHNPPSPYLREPAAQAEEDMNTKIDDAIANALDQKVQGNGPTVDLEIETEIQYVV